MIRKLTLLLILTGIISACNPKVQVHGYIPRASEIALLEPEKFDKAQIVALIGTPSFINEFADNRWNYVAFRTEQIGFEKPNITQYSVLQLIFNSENQRLTSIKQTSKDDLIPLEFDPSLTPSSGREMTIMEQLVGNLGRFN